MKTLNSSVVSPFGGLNFVLNEFNKLKIDTLIEDNSTGARILRVT